MKISADLDRIERHQDYIQQERRTAEILLNCLQEQYQLSVGISEKQAEICKEHIQFMQEWNERTRQRGELLNKVHETLSEAKQIMSGNASEAKAILQNIQ